MKIKIDPIGRIKPVSGKTYLLVLLSWQRLEMQNLLVLYLTVFYLVLYEQFLMVPMKPKPLKLQADILSSIGSCLYQCQLIQVTLFTYHNFFKSSKNYTKKLMLN